MKTVIGLSLMLLGIVVGLYVCIWWAFVGGIVDIVNELKSTTDANALAIAWGLAKVFFAAPLGWLSFLVVSGTGYAIATK